MKTSCGKREGEESTVENQESIYEEKQGNLLTGILGALLGALIGIRRCGCWSAYGGTSQASSRG